MSPLNVRIICLLVPVPCDTVMVLLTSVEIVGLLPFLLWLTSSVPELPDTLEEGRIYFVALE